MPGTEKVITAVDLQKSYPAGGGELLHVLRGVSLSVCAGEVLFLIGPSGSGKSTLLSILGCLLTPDFGEVRIFDEDPTQLSAAELARFRLRNIGFVFQQFHLFDGLTAAENVQVPLDLRGTARPVGRTRVLELLGCVGLVDKANVDVKRLSVGQKQRVAIARALVGAPKIIFADEPTASLDAESGRSTMDLIRRLAKEQGTAVVVVTHDSRILEYADRTLRISDGELQQEPLPPNPGVVCQNVNAGAAIHLG